MSTNNEPASSQYYTYYYYYYYDDDSSDNMSNLTRLPQPVSIVSPLQFLYIEMLRIFGIGLLSLFGTVTNAINLVVFYRHGLLSDSCTASLFGLSVSDFCNCLLSSWCSACYGLTNYVHMPSFDDFNDVCLMSAEWPMHIFTHITCWVTAYIAFERLFSVMFPFKVKVVFTPNRSHIVVGAIFVVSIVTYFPQYAQGSLGWRETEFFNRSFLIGFIDNKNIADLYDTYALINKVILRFACVTIVLVCNIGIFLKVNISKKFRKSASSLAKPSRQEKGKDLKTSSAHVTNSQAGRKQHRERKLLRMVAAICLLFLVCYATDIAIVFLVVLGFGPYYDDLSSLFWTHTNSSLTIINASVNSVIYYTMSTRFREEFNLLFCRKR